MPSRDLPLSVLDLAVIGRGETAAHALGGSVEIARLAESCGYRRVWYAEHHNIPTIASSATSVLIAHVAANTASIRLGAGGIMLPNHAPLTIAEQFGTLATLHPGRIDLGVGRAPGSDQATMLALRRHLPGVDTFPQDVLELQGYLGDETRVAGVRATPGTGTHVPLYVLGSSLYGAGLAAALGLPFGFASHFAPAALEQAVALYRREFRPSATLDRPYVIAGVNVTAADTADEAREQLRLVNRGRAVAILAAGRRLSDDEADELVRSPQGRVVAEMMRYAAVGTPEEVGAYLCDFARHADADELIVVPASPTLATRLRSLELVAGVMGLAPVPTRTPPV